MPLTELGFKRRTFDEILNDMIALAQQYFGEDIDTSELTPLGKFIRINAFNHALTEEESEMIYYSIFPNTAVGTSLDRLCNGFVGISRNAATSSKYNVTFNGTDGAVIPIGFLVGTESGINYQTMEEITIGEDGKASAVVECVDKGGIGNVIPQEINTIVNPSADVASVIGESLISNGEETESDYELRNRFDAAKEGLGSCNELAVKAALLRIPTVTHAGVIVNDTDETDSGGRPPRSFECFINGGLDYHQQIAETIFDKKPMGIKTHGKVSQEIIDSGGYAHIINFSHTTNQPVYVRMSIKTSAEFEGDTGKKEIKNNIKTYIDNVGIGSAVVLSSLYGKIHSVAGVQEVTELLMSTDGASWSTSNITVDSYENCVCMAVEIKQNDADNYEVI